MYQQTPADLLKKLPHQPAASVVLGTNREMRPKRKQQYKSLNLVNPKFLVEPRQKFLGDAELLAHLQHLQPLTAQQLQAAETTWNNAGSRLRPPSDSTHAHGSATAHFVHTGCLYFASDMQVQGHATQVSCTSSMSGPQVCQFTKVASINCRLHIPAAVQSCITASSLYKTRYREIFSTRWLGLMPTTTVTMNWMSRWSRIGLITIYLTRLEVLPSKIPEMTLRSTLAPCDACFGDLQIRIKGSEECLFRATMNAVSAALHWLHEACTQSMSQLADAANTCSL